jgi:hypothetical protein
VLAVPLFALLFEAEWTGSIAPLVALSFGQAFMFVSAPSIALLKAQGRFRVYFIWQVAQLAGSVALFACAVTYGGEPSLRLASSLGLPIDAEAGKALAISIASAISWAISCPIAVYLGGRPAKLRTRVVAGLFLQPWLIAAPIMALVAFAWIWMRGALQPTTADALALFVVGPIAVLAGILGCVYSRKETRDDFQRVIGRFARRSARA